MLERYEPIKGLSFRLLGRDAREAIADGAYRILEKIGMKLTEKESRGILRDAGAILEGDRVHLPAALVREAIDSAPETLSLYDQKGSEALELSGSKSYFGASVDGPALLDPEEREYRDCY